MRRLCLRTRVVIMPARPAHAGSGETGRTSSCVCAGRDEENGAMRVGWNPRGRLIAATALVLFVDLSPRTPSAQGTSAAAITGVVKDASGGVLPGVAVEASSPALIEK